jgi:hypothetical protein
MITYYVLKTESNYKIVDSITHEINSEGKLVKRKEPIFIMRRPLVSWDYDEILKIVEELEFGEYRVLGTF